MNTTEGEFLFAGHWLSDYLRRRALDIRPFVEAIPQAELEASDDDTLAARVLADVRVEPLVLDRDNIELETNDVTLDARDDPRRIARFIRNRFVPLPATRYTFSLPFSGDTELWGLTPSTFGTVHARGIVHGSERGAGRLALVFVLPKDSKEDLQEHLEEELALIDQNRDRQRPEIEAFNNGLRNEILRAVVERRREFSERDDLAARMGVRLKVDAPRSPSQPSRAPQPASTRPSEGVAGQKQWDVFVSYAGEDRDTVAKPLAEALRAKGLAVWFDKFELSLGDRLRRKIDEGLANSRFGVVILSRAFFQKHWPQVELDGLAQREEDGAKVILPVWHEIDHAGIAAYSPTLADRVAVLWSQGVDAVVDSILQVVKSS